MNIPAFLEAVNTCLKAEARPPVVQPIQSPVVSTAPPPVKPPITLPEVPRARSSSPETLIGTPSPSLAASLTSLLTSLRREISALAILLLDPNGRVVAQSGSFPEASFEDRWSDVLMEALRATIRVSTLLESSQPRNLVILQGKAFDLVLSPVGSYALVLVLRTGLPTLRLGLAFEELLNVQKNLLATISSTRLAAAPVSPAAAPAAQPPAQNAPPSSPTKSAPPSEPALSKKVSPTGPLKADEPPSEEFAALFRQQAELDSQDVEAFWETASGSDVPLAPGKDAITYEQARKMGLAPGLDEEEK